jgi:hypothetical protein
VAGISTPIFSPFQKQTPGIGRSLVQTQQIFRSKTMESGETLELHVQRTQVANILFKHVALFKLNVHVRP